MNAKALVAEPLKRKKYASSITLDYPIKYVLNHDWIESNIPLLLAITVEANKLPSSSAGSNYVLSYLHCLL
jgi:hypothetical protein